jgi:hypothetical protein
MAPLRPPNMAKPTTIKIIFGKNGIKDTTTLSKIKARGAKKAQSPKNSDRAFSSVKIPILYNLYKTKAKNTKDIRVSMYLNLFLFLFKNLEKRLISLHTYAEAYANMEIYALFDNIRKGCCS